ncbi:protein quick-to-court isoform X1 [Pieris brassicae]|uniref:GRIP domain-containing protein n=1 Tax=Pieris brassicae TaxID=7116 RepID=A0A9P0TIP5_PIEBR|nr:protein quick-to-court isoform X1 [Pieris brassicae]XP_045522777.1 protein quick-to-court isoform X1 [Pieris brassicae]XP_045522778.1 protein quick-to-court isoform X1 [Pieris brassicae]CAH4029963.1 unnamed protein product [Pieris brassicae]
MSRNNTRRIAEFQDDVFGAGNIGNFRRTASLRLRGEKMVQRSPLLARKYIPVITENGNSKRSDGSRLPEPSHRPRSQSFHANSQIRPKKSCLKMQDCLDRKLSMTDSANTPPGSPEDLPDDDSLHSYGSAATAASIDAGYAPFNGTTFSGRSMRYVLHCSSHAGLAGEEYLTPTQRAQKQIRRLKSLLSQAKQDLDKKDSEIFQLTKEVVELRLYKASVFSPDEKSNSSEIVTVRENEEGIEEQSVRFKDTCRSYDVVDSPFKDHSTPTRCRNEMQGSFTDSGHFDDLTNSSLHSKESVHMLMHDASCMTESLDSDEERRSLISFYDKKIEDVMRAHVGETQEMKKAHNDKVEALLQKLADVNTRYCELLPNYEQAKERIHVLEKQLEEASRQLQDEENRQRAVYLQMYNKGMEAAKFQFDKEVDGEGSQNQLSRVSVEELLEQLQITQTELENVRDTAFATDRTASQVLLSAKEAVSLWVLGARKAMYRRIVESQKGAKSNVDPEVTLQFLKSAIYYFLTDPENHQGHLNAIENILGFTEAEKKNIRKARLT